MSRNTRPVSWLKCARKHFEEFPKEAQLDVARALTIQQLVPVLKPGDSEPYGCWSALIEQHKIAVDIRLQR